MYGVENGMVYADFESILNQLMSGMTGKARYTEKINTHGPSEWCVHSTFAYGDVLDHLKIYQCKDCLEKFVEHIEEEVKRLSETFQRQYVLVMSLTHFRVNPRSIVA